MIVERLRRRSFFGHEAVSEQLKESGPWLNSIYVYYFFSAATDTEKGHLLE